MSRKKPRRGSRDERIAAIYAEAARRSQEKREREEATRAKGSCGLPPTEYRAARSSSIATRSPRRTAGKHHAN